MAVYLPPWGKSCRLDLNWFLWPCGSAASEPNWGYSFTSTIFIEISRFRFLQLWCIQGILCHVSHNGKLSLEKCLSIFIRLEFHTKICMSGSLLKQLSSVLCTSTSFWIIFLLGICHYFLLLATDTKLVTSVVLFIFFCSCMSPVFLHVTISDVTSL